MKFAQARLKNEDAALAQKSTVQYYPTISS